MNMTRPVLGAFLIILLGNGAAWSGHPQGDPPTEWAAAAQAKEKTESDQGNTGYPMLVLDQAPSFSLEGNTGSHEKKDAPIEKHQLEKWLDPANVLPVCML